MPNRTFENLKTLIEARIDQAIREDLENPGCLPLSFIRLLQHSQYNALDVAIRLINENFPEFDAASLKNEITIKDFKQYILGLRTTKDIQPLVFRGKVFIRSIEKSKNHLAEQLMQELSSPPASLSPFASFPLICEQGEEVPFSPAQPNYVSDQYSIPSPCVVSSAPSKSGTDSLSILQALSSQNQLPKTPAAPTLKRAGYTPWLALCDLQPTENNSDLELNIPDSTFEQIRNMTCVVDQIENKMNTRRNQLKETGFIQVFKGQQKLIITGLPFNTLESIWNEVKPLLRNIELKIKNHGSIGINARNSYKKARMETTSSSTSPSSFAKNISADEEGANQGAQPTELLVLR